MNRMSKTISRVTWGMTSVQVSPCRNPLLAFTAVVGLAASGRRLFRDARTGAVDLSMDPNAPDTLYAGLWEVYRTPHSLSSGGPGSGLFKSTDGGATWTELSKNAGLPSGLWGKVGVAVSPVDARRVYAIVENENGGVFDADPTANPVWQDANWAFGPYCSSDFFTGTRTHPIPAWPVPDDDWYFSGRLNVQALLETLVRRYGLDDRVDVGARILYGGTSAGAMNAAALA